MYSAPICKWLSVLTLKCQNHSETNNLPLWHECQKNLTKHYFYKLTSTLSNLLCICTNSKKNSKYLITPLELIVPFHCCNQNSCADVPNIIFLCPISIICTCVLSYFFYSDYTCRFYSYLPQNIISPPYYLHIKSYLPLFGYLQSLPFYLPKEWMK